MNVGSSRGLLVRSSRDLVEAWRETQRYWRDARAAQFDKDFIADIPKSVGSAATVIQDIDAILNRIRRDCE